MSSILQTVRDAGLSVSIVESDKLMVAPASRITPELRALIRSHKDDLIHWCITQPANEPEPPGDPSTWHELAKEYNQHHFKCKTCQAAGRGSQYGLRCGVGASLWSAYQKKIDAAPR
jgi:hypothetical protein